MERNQEAKKKLDQLRISMKYNPKETVSKIKQASSRRSKILKKLRHASKLVSMVQSMKKTEKSAREFKTEIKQLKKSIKSQKKHENHLHSIIDDCNVKI